MPAFPSQCLFRAHSITQMQPSALESFRPERGLPKYRKKVADVLIEQRGDLIFKTKKSREDFFAWFKNEIGSGVGFFDWKDPTTGEIVQARIKDGQLGDLSMVDNKFGIMASSVVIEFLRAV